MPDSLGLPVNKVEPKPTVLLYALETVGLIIPCPSGVIYQQQTGGYTCLQDRLEGAFVPLYDIEDLTENLELYFTGPNWRGNCDRGIDDNTADVIDALFAKVPGYATIKVDRERLAESHEAWVHVSLRDPSSMGLIEGFPPGPAVLTWGNSD